MLAENRQQKLDVALAALRNIPGIVDVSSDDWDSSAIDVFLTLEPERTSYVKSSTIYHFKSNINVYKARIKALLRKAGIGFGFLDWPAKKYSSNGTVFGKSLKFDEGYDGTAIKIEVYI